MIVTFDKEYLKELYESGKANDKKHHFQPEIIRRYKRCIDIMISVSNITALYKYNGIEFIVTEMRGEIVTTICNIIELSNHYK